MAAPRAAESKRRGFRGRPRRRGAGTVSITQGLSTTGYLEFNPDLVALAEADSALENHYVDFGMAEGRAYKLDEDRYGQLPADFDADVYIDINPDLEPFRERFYAARVHYLATGRDEGRSYKVVVLSEDRREPSIVSLSPASDWRDVFVPGDFRALHPDLALDAATSGALLAAFEARGIDALAPLSLDRTFDPDFYTALFPKFAGLAPPARYRAWLDEGLPAGRPGSEPEALHNLLGLTVFPDVFDWRGYAAQIGPRHGAGYACAASSIWWRWEQRVVT